MRKATTKKFVPKFKFCPSYVRVVQIKNGQYYCLPIIRPIQYDQDIIQIFVGED